MNALRTTNGDDVTGPTESQVDINDSVWSRDVEVYTGLDSWTDPGERALLQRLAPQTRGRAILDVGVGAGRSAWYLTLLSEDYVAVDLNQDMVDAARRNLPAADIRQADARDLSQFPDARFDLVYFSHAGLDAIDHVGRRQALDEFVRVTSPGGHVAYSTLNRLGPFWHAGPGPVASPGHRPNPYNYARFAARLALHPARHVHGFRSAHRLRAMAEDHGAWGTDTMPTHDWSLLVHYVTAAAAWQELTDVGLEPVAIIGDDGRDLDPAAENRDIRWFHLLGRKPA